MKRRELLRLGAVSTAAAVVFPATGCATLCDLLGNLIHAPDIAIKSMKIRKASLSSISTRFLVNITNPNAFGFNLAGLEYGLALAGGNVAKGMAPKGITLRPKGRATTELDIDFDIARTAVAVLEMIEKGAIEYALETVGHFKAQNQDIPVPAKITGMMPMPQLPKIDISSFNVVSANLSGVKFRVNTEAKNKNDFDMPIDKFEFDVKLGGKSVLKNKAIRNKKLKGAKSTSVPLEFTVGLAALGLTAAELATNPKLDWRVDTLLESGLIKLPFDQKGSVRIA